MIISMDSNQLLSKKITPVIKSLINCEDQSSQQIEETIDLLMKHDLDGYYWLAFTVALHTKGETVDELFGICKSIEKLYNPIHFSVDESRIIDVSGTGGSKSFNISTATAFVLAGGGAYVAKQSSGAVTGKTGSADIMKMLGINLRAWQDTEVISSTLEKVGIVIYQNFLEGGSPNTRAHFLKNLRKMGISFRSSFHIVGGLPLPHKARRLWGCYSPSLLPLYAELFPRLGYQQTIIVSSRDGFDEFSPFAMNDVVEIRENSITRRYLEPKDFGLGHQNSDDLGGLSAEQNIIDFLRVLSGVERGPKRIAVLQNAAAGFYILDIVSNLRDGMNIAGAAIDRGRALDKLVDFVGQVGDIQALDHWLAKANRIEVHSSSPHLTIKI